MPKQYLTNPQVIHETIDGETIIIDLQTGTYFSLRGAAPTIWNSLTAGHSQPQITERLLTLYTTENTDLHAAVDSFLKELQREGLIHPTDTQPQPPPPTSTQPVSQRVPFDEPKLERFEDMQDIILLDPVHKVDTQGWPHPAPTGSQAA